MHKRAMIIVLDSAGIGALPDAEQFGDTGSNTIGNIYHHRGSLALENMYRLGLAHIEGSMLPMPEDPVTGAYGRAMEQTFAKDTTCGHWEMAGLPLEVPFKTYPNGFPSEFLDAFKTRIGRDLLGNEVASGTEIIQRLGDEHVRTGRPIVYTSADSVFQIAAHKDVIPLDELYRICEIARSMLVGDNLVGRVIARPFTGTSGAYKRTEERKDYALEPPADTLLDLLQMNGKVTVGVGKIEDIFCRRGISIVDHTRNNQAGIDAAIRLLKEDIGDFLFVNLVDFDMLYGHRNDVEGYAGALEAFDRRLPEILGAMKDEDLLIITADHGCDPTTPSTDHSREYVPILVSAKQIKAGVNIGTRESFADIGATVYEYLTGEELPHGTSFLHEII